MPKAEPKDETVILLHGIGHSFLTMVLLERRLKSHGYQTHNVTYPSTKYDIKTLSGWLHNNLQEYQIWERSEKVHFVAHSMGGLVSGFYLQDYKGHIPPQKMGRVVMLGTPHGGSEVADSLKDFWLYQQVFGPAGQELTTSLRGKNQITPDYELGIIAGTQNWLYPLGKLWVNNPHDGCVSVESTKIEGMTDHHTLPVLHGIMGWSRKVQIQILHFLEEGTFKK